MTEKSASLSYPFPLARQVKGLSGTANEDLETWPTIFEPGLDKSLQGYLKRKKAVIEYLSGASDSTLRLRYGLGLKGIYRLIVHRCLKEHRDGQIYGWRGQAPLQKAANVYTGNNIPSRASRFGPSRRPVSTSYFLTSSCNVTDEQPIVGAIDSTAAHCDGRS